MFLFSLSLPGRFGNWCDAVIGRLAQTALGPVASTGANTAEELAVELIRNGNDHLYVGARHPSRWLQDILVTGHRRFVVAVSDPRLVTSELIREQHLELPVASRLVACSCASLYRLAACPGALVVSAEMAQGDPAAAVAAIADHLDLPVARSAVAGIVDDLNAVGLSPGGASAEAPTAMLPDQAASAIEGALGAYAAFFRSGSFPPIIWTRELFLEDHHLPASHPIEIAGAIRYLIYGPYISLPPGTWAAEMVLGFSEAAVESSFRVEVWAGTLLVLTQIQPTAAGLQRVNINFTVDESNDQPVEIRVVNEQVAIGGRLVLGYAILRLVTDLSSAVADSLSAELGLPQSVLPQSRRLSL